MNIAVLFKAYKLLPGELILVTEPSYIDTILGSCVSITVYHPRTKFAIMSHSILPRCKEQFYLNRDCLKEKYKFVDTTVEYINGEVLKRFLDKNELEVKIFGGSNLINSDGAINIGEQNANTALELLQSYGFQIKSIDVGGNYGRRVLFDTNTGDVWVKKLRALTELNLCTLKYTN